MCYILQFCCTYFFFHVKSVNQKSALRGTKYIDNAFVTIVAREGPEALHKGFVPVLTRKILWCASFFLTYEALRSA